MIRVSKWQYTKKGLNVLSIFDGMSCGRIALERAGIKVNNYYSSEIDKYAIQIANKNYPQDAVNRLGDFIIRNYKESEKIKEPIEGIKRLVEGLRKDVKKL